MKSALFFLAAVIILTIFSGGCGASSTPVSFNSLVSEPEKYSGKTVTVEGIYVRGWEWIVLAESVAILGTGDAAELKPVGESIWFAGLMPVEIQDGLYQYLSPTGDNSYYGKIRVTGLFETKGKYGNMNRYKYRITASAAESLEWTPPE